MEDLQRTVLFDRHQGLGALMAPFGGWNMPIQYQGILAEHRWCREKAALFDICHMGEFLYQGDLEQGGLEEVFTFSVKGIPIGRSRYGFLLDERGGIIDDLIVFRLAEQEAMIVVNAATIANDFAVIKARLKQGALFTDISGETGKIDLQGPLARRVMAEKLGSAVENLPYFRFIRTTILGIEATVSRTGYTGELGYEIFLPASRVAELWDRLLADDRVRPAGLGARDLLRLEVGYSLYGSDIDQTTTPLEAGLEAFVDFGKPFVGREALLRQKREGLARTRVAFRCASRRTPRHDYRILNGGEPVGRVTSGAFSPMLGCGIGLGYVDGGAATPGTALTVVHENVAIEATVCPLPFYRGGSLRT